MSGISNSIIRVNIKICLKDQLHHNLNESYMTTYRVQSVRKGYLPYSEKGGLQGYALYFYFRAFLPRNCVFYYSKVI